jgi:hypothetical protein
VYTCDNEVIRVRLLGTHAGGSPQAEADQRRRQASPGQEKAEAHQGHGFTLTLQSFEDAVVVAIGAAVVLAASAAVVGTFEVF